MGGRSNSSLVNGAPSNHNSGDFLSRRFEGMATKDASAEEVLRTISSAVVVDVNIQSLQAALRWLVQQHEANKDALKAADDDRTALMLRVAALEQAAESAASQQADAVAAVAEKLDATQKQVEEVAATAAELAQLTEEGRTVDQQLLEAVDALEVKSEEVHGRLEQAAAEAEQLRGADATLAASLEQHAADAAAADAAMGAELRSIQGERLPALEERARATSERLETSESQLDSRLDTLSQQSEARLDALRAELGGALRSVEERLDASTARMAEMNQSKPVPSATVLQVAPTETAASAIEEADVPQSLSGRLGHVEWLLDAIQVDLEATHASVAKHKQQIAAQAEQQGELQAAINRIAGFGGSGGEREGHRAVVCAGGGLCVTRPDRRRRHRRLSVRHHLALGRPPQLDRCGPARRAPCRSREAAWCV